MSWNGFMICARCGESKLAECFPLGEGGRHKRICRECSPGDVKQCTGCSETKPVGAFHRQPNAPDGRAYNCKDCMKRYAQSYARDKAGSLKETRARYYRENRERLRKRAADKNRERKIRVLKAYGGVCVCCGERNLGLLTLDHRNGDGAQHRRDQGWGQKSIRAYAWAEENGFPDLLQVMCWNCNSGRHYNGGVCPHKDGTWVSISGLEGNQG